MKRQTCPVADEKTNGTYFCSRDVGHDGPCAAHPIPKNYKSSRMFYQAIRRALIRGGCKNSKLLMTVTERAQLSKEDYESMCIVCGLPQGGHVSGPYCYAHNPVKGNL